MLLVPCLWAKPYAFPVPFVPKKNQQYIFFKDLPGPGTIKIYTITGEEVISLRITEDNDLPHWDTKNTSGKLVASGVYLYRIDTGNDVTMGKLVIIR